MNSHSADVFNDNNKTNHSYIGGMGLASGYTLISFMIFSDSVGSIFTLIIFPIWMGPHEHSTMISTFFTKSILMAETSIVFLSKTIDRM
jgi:hypothetical protein